ncbi:MAG TPA: DUF1499 domain-containing protein [Aurantimonas coralicida]|uniref:DUF1499 domain-containing protein n=2 Tax=root TaxID=1 RepID=A0A9C9TGA0_9HYPH|nr:DUF1499 domain-containing protein [Aurantimonas coralicida]HEU00107.1 DUF1499 domain-containing protein [Aurantimonas coralicida]
MKSLRWFVLVAVALPLLVFGGVFLAGPERVWELFGGPADQGAVDFSTLARRSTPNDALACSPDACDGVTDVELPLYRDPPAALLDRLDAIVLVDSDVARVDDGGRQDYRRYVARTPLLRFPDTIDAEALPGSDGTRLRLYSRSLLGASDFDANGARLENWTAQLRAN